MVREDRVIMSVKELRRVHVHSPDEGKEADAGPGGCCAGADDNATSGASLSGWSRRGTRGWRTAGGADRRTGGSRSRSRQRPSGSMRSGMGTSGRCAPRRT